MRLLCWVLLVAFSFIMLSSQVGAEKIQDLGEQVKVIKTLPTGEEMRVYKRVQVEKRQRSEVSIDEWVGDWQVEDCSIAICAKGSENANVMLRFKNSYPLSGKAFPSYGRNIAVMDVATEGDHGYLLTVNFGNLSVGAIKRMSDGSWKIQDGAMGLTRGNPDAGIIPIAATVLPDDQIEVTLSNNTKELWAIVDNFDEKHEQEAATLVQGSTLTHKKAVRLSQWKLEDEKTDNVKTN